MSGAGVIRLRIAAMALVCTSTILVSAPAFAAAQDAISRSDGPSEALARYVRLLSVTPNNFEALIGAGRAALELGDTQAAAGFYGRAEEVNPRSPLPQAGIGAALAQSGDGGGALRYFQSAVQLGATPSMIGADRGLAYDLLGRTAEAQADYRAAIARGGVDGEEARRRLALSLAIAGDKPEALAQLSPLMSRGDSGAARVRALVLALSGDAIAARAALDAAMPGAGTRMDPFFRRLPALRTDQKAAAVHLGIFPGTGQPAYAAATAPSFAASIGTGRSGGGDRLSDIEQMLSGTSGSAPVAPVASAVAQPGYQPRVRVASLPTTQQVRAAAQPSAILSTKRYWLQLASGPNVSALPDQFRKLQQRDRELLGPLKPYVFEDGTGVRLLIGPFKDMKDAGDFATALEDSRVSAFTWTLPQGRTVRKLEP